ncbi:hypothetical protein L3Q82_012347 [Scortum barcoo]|uniref:Uncharacterized protein n=1 Tax=Scortum barcoo TaxID=214431 RepID=A0ACB8W2V6_9TELE|nr:hypothetical protein L3Q82_012347 [Scortum barcoo]
MECHLAGGKEPELSVREVERYRLEIVGLTSMHSMGSGTQLLEMGLDPPLLWSCPGVLEGLWEVCPTNPHVLCGSGEGILTVFPRGILWGVLHEYWGPGPFAKGCSVSVRLEQELGSHCRQIFMDRISRCSKGPEGVRVGNHRISSLLFADDVVLLASSSQDLQHVLGGLQPSVKWLG